MMYPVEEPKQTRSSAFFYEIWRSFQAFHRLDGTRDAVVDLFITRSGLIEKRMRKNCVVIRSVRGRAERGCCRVPKGGP